MIHEENNDFRSLCPILAISTIRKQWADLLVCYKNSQGSLSKINATELNRNGEVQWVHSTSPLAPPPYTLRVCGQHNLSIAGNLKNFFLKSVVQVLAWRTPLRILVGITLQAWRYRLNPQETFLPEKPDFTPFHQPAEVLVLALFRTWI